MNLDELKEIFGRPNVITEYYVQWNVYDKCQFVFYRKINKIQFFNPNPWSPRVTMSEFLSKINEDSYFKLIFKLDTFMEFEFLG